MKESGKMAAGLIIFIGLIVWCLAPVFAQTTTFNFHPDGSTSRKHVSDFGVSISRFDREMRVLEKSHYFPGGVRMRLSTKYRYENNMLVEKVAYNYTQGYEKDIYRFNQYGYETENRSYTSQTEGNWKEISYLIQGYNERNNRIYFRSKYTGPGTLTNKMSRTTYDYDKRTSSTIWYDFDRNDREISSSRSRSGIADWQLERAGEFVFDINKHFENKRSNRAVYWTDYDSNGNRVEKTFVNHNTVFKTIDKNGRVIRIVFASPDSDGEDVPLYQEDEGIDFRYDVQGRLIETESFHYDESYEKTTFKHGRNVEAKHYRRNKNGSWKLMSTKSYANLDEFTPHQVSNGNQPVASSTKQENTGISAQSEMYETPVAQSTSAKPSQALPSQSLVNDLNGIHIASNQKESLSAFSLDAEKLTHIADVLSHTTGTEVTEEQVLALAMQLLIENYNADLREMNTAYLKDKVSVFD